MVKAITSVLVVIAIFGEAAFVVQGRSYVPRNWQYSMYSTTQQPSTSSPEESVTSSTVAPPLSQEDESNQLSINAATTGQNINAPTEGDGKSDFIIVADPKTGDVFYIPADTFWARFGSAGGRTKRSTSNERTSRVLENIQEPRLHLDEVRQIDDVTDDEEKNYNEKYSDYLRSVSQYLTPYYEDNEALSDESVEYEDVQVQGNRRDAPTWQPSDVFQAFFPNYRYSPNKIVYTYSSLCANGCMNNKKYYERAPIAESISADTSSTSVTPTSTSTTTTTTTTTTDASSLEEQSTATANTDIEIESTTAPTSQVVDYEHSQQGEVPAA